MKQAEYWCIEGVQQDFFLDSTLKSYLYLEKKITIEITLDTTIKDRNT